MAGLNGSEDEGEGKRRKEEKRKKEEGIARSISNPKLFESYLPPCLAWGPGRRRHETSCPRIRLTPDGSLLLLTVPVSLATRGSNRDEMAG